MDETMAPEEKKPAPLSWDDYFRLRKRGTDSAWVLACRLMGRDQEEKALRDLERFLDGPVCRLVDEGNRMSAFHLICDTYEALTEEGVYRVPFDGFLAMDAVHAALPMFRYAWDYVLAKATLAEKDEMCQWFCEQPFEPTGLLADTMLDEHWEDQHEERHLSVFRKWVGECGEDYRPLAPRVLYLMREMGCGDDEIHETLGKYEDVEEVLLWEVDRREAMGDFAGAISRVRKGIQEDLIDGDEGRLRMARLYGATGDRKRQRTQLMKCVFKGSGRSLEPVKDLKEITLPEEWPELFERILAADQWKNSTARLLEMDGQYDRLKKILEKSTNIRFVGAYANSMLAWDPEWFLYNYARCVDLIMKEARKKDGYEEAIGYLCRLRDMQGGQERAKTLAEEWKQRYPRRRLMQEALTREGF